MSLTLTTAELSAIRLSLGVATAATLVALPPGILLGWLLARRRFPGKVLVETATLLPLVLPPTVTGYVLLVLLGRGGPLAGLQILFTWKAMLLAAAVVGFPLLVRSARAAFEAVDPGLGRAARTLGCSRLGEFLSITLPLAWPGLLAGTVLCFARALGEFGATRMVSLNTEGQRTIALEVFQLVETPGQHGPALLRLVLFSVALSAVALALCEGLARRWKRGTA